MLHVRDHVICGLWYQASFTPMLEHVFILYLLMFQHKDIYPHALVDTCLRCFHFLTVMNDTAFFLKIFLIYLFDRERDYK